MNSAGMQPAAGVEDKASNGRLSDEAGNIDENSSTASTTSSVNYGAFLSGKRYHLKKKPDSFSLESNLSHT